MWKQIKQWFSSEPQPAPLPQPGSAATAVAFQAPRPDLAEQEPSWIAAGDNPFGVPVLDVRPITLGTLSTSRDPMMARNAVSYGGETGTSFATEPPAFERPLEGALRFRAPPQLVDGALFIPSEMEDKWALFVQRGELILVRSWRRQVFLRAALHVTADGYLDVTELNGVICDTEEPPEFTLRALDFILRTHALRLDWPAALPADTSDEPRGLALLCMSYYGRHARFAAREAPTRDIPLQPLQTL